jgi:hypothetical protein
MVADTVADCFSGAVSNKVSDVAAILHTRPGAIGSSDVVYLQRQFKKGM